LGAYSKEVLLLMRIAVFSCNAGLPLKVPRLLNYWQVTVDSSSNYTGMC